MRKRALGLCIAIFCMAALDVYGQTKPMKWGNIPQEDLQMISYEADTNAVAVILGEYGEIKVEQSGEMVFDYHIRVKLLSEAAYDDWGTYYLTYNKGQLKERIRDVEGQTFVLSPEGGKPAKHKLGKKSIFKEKLDGNFEQIRFTLPALAPGAVVEFRYKLISDTPVFLPDWTFQHDEPTRWSELRADISWYYNHVRISTVRNYAIDEEEKSNMPGQKSVKYRWAMNDVPALREEPYVTTIEDYRQKMEFQLASYYHPNQGTIQYMRNWDELAKELRDIGEFGRAFKSNKIISNLAKELTAGIGSSKDQMIAIFEYVRDNHRWDGGYGYIPDHHLPGTLKKDRISAADQTVLIVALLRAAGLEANPVLISTRSHGRVKKAYPIFSQFNYVITHVNIGGRDYFLDATEEKGPYNVLTERALNSPGWMVTKSRHEWVPIRSGAKYTQLINLNGKVAADGSVELDLSSSSSGYRALELREALAGTDADEFVGQNIIEKTGEFEVRDIQITNEDSLLKPLNVEADLRIQSFGFVAGDFMYFSPHAVSTWEENPLRLPERSFPVDFSYPRDYVYNLRLELPEGYSVHEQLQNMNLKLPQKGGAFRRSCVVEGNMLVVQSRFTLTNSVYPARMYKNLREMYDRVVAAQAEQIVLKKVVEAGHE